MNIDYVESLSLSPFYNDYVFKTSPTRVITTQRVITKKSSRKKRKKKRGRSHEEIERDTKRRKILQEINVKDRTSVQTKELHKLVNRESAQKSRIKRQRLLRQKDEEIKRLNFENKKLNLEIVRLKQKLSFYDDDYNM
jgi:hypothetical protein